MENGNKKYYCEYFEKSNFEEDENLIKLMKEKIQRAEPERIFEFKIEDYDDKIFIKAY